MFKPSQINMGHDEVDALGRCPKCAGKAPHELFAQDVVKIHDFLGAKGIRMQIHGDMLLNPENIPDKYFPGYFKGGAPMHIHKALDLLPKDVVMADWHYDRNERYPVQPVYPSVDIFKKHGLEVLGYASWYRESNVYSFSQYMWKNGFRRMVVSTWCPVSLCLPKKGGDGMPRLKYVPQALKGIEMGAEYFWSLDGVARVNRDEHPANPVYWDELEYTIKDEGEEFEM
ncbi:MAG: hypothetical protein PHV34_05420 [Verrucomicrobiae bacterium]|nr:hypothetical protein [Verrucomicrobiae bacterium]